MQSRVRQAFRHLGSIAASAQSKASLDFRVSRTVLTQSNRCWYFHAARRRTTKVNRRRELLLLLLLLQAAVKDRRKRRIQRQSTAATRSRRKGIPAARDRLRLVWTEGISSPKTALPPSRSICCWVWNSAQRFFMRRCHETKCDHHMRAERCGKGCSSRTISTASCKWPGQRSITS